MTLEILGAGPVSAVLDDAAPLPQHPDLAALEAAGAGWTTTDALGGTLWIAVGPGAHAITATP